MRVSSGGVPPGYMSAGTAGQFYFYTDSGGALRVVTASVSSLELGLF